MKTITTTDIFTGMAATLADPARWTQGAEARDAAGEPVLATDPRAVCWCLYGARELELARVRSRALRRRFDDETDELLHEAANGVSPSAVNDDPSGGHAGVLALIGRASARSASAAIGQPVS